MASAPPKILNIPYPRSLCRVNTYTKLPNIGITNIELRNYILDKLMSILPEGYELTVGGTFYNIILTCPQDDFFRLRIDFWREYRTNNILIEWHNIMRSDVITLRLVSDWFRRVYRPDYFQHMHFNMPPNGNLTVGPNLPPLPIFPANSGAANPN